MKERQKESKEKNINRSLKNGCLIRRLTAGAAVILGITAVCALYSFCETVRDYQRGDQDLSRVYEAMEEGSPSIGKEAGTRQISQESRRLAGYGKLKEMNSDLIGWVRVEGTKVNYPVMQTLESPDFYLTHGFDKRDSAYGMIYLDTACSLEGECHNYVLYGHHMKNGAMFAVMENYESREFYESNPVISFDTLEVLGDYEVAAALKLPAEKINGEFSQMLAAGTKEDYGALIQYVKEQGFYDTGITPEWPEQLLTLVTCEYTQKDGRFLVVARRRETAG